jgi:hypothetical protein
MGESVCPAHSGVCVNIENIQKQTDNNTKEIKTLSDAVIKLTILVEDCTSRVTPPPKASFWDADTKKVALKFGFIICIVVILALIGTNVLPQVNLSELLK